MLLEFTYFIFNIHLQKKTHSYITKHTLQKSTRSWDLRRSQVTRLVWVVQVSKLKIKVS